MIKYMLHLRLRLTLFDISVQLLKNVVNMLVYVTKVDKEKNTLEKTEGAIKYKQSRDTGNSGHTKHVTKTSNKHNTTHNTKQMSNTDPTKNWE